MTSVERMLVLLMLCVIAPLFAAEEIQQWVPLPVEQCVEKQHPRSELITTINPLYLRGDFDGDGRMDYAVRVVAESRDRDNREAAVPGTSGLLLCHASGDSVVLGGGLGPLPEGAEPGFLLAPNWEVLPADASATTTLGARGESITMIWDDGSAVIYLKDDRYRWHWIE